MGNQNRPPYPLHWNNEVAFHLSSSQVISSNSVAPINEDSRIFMGDVQRPQSKIHPPSSNVTCSTSGRHPASSTDIVHGNERKRKASAVVGTRETAARGHSFPSRLPTSWTSIHHLPLSFIHPSIHRLTSITRPPGVSALKLMINEKCKLLRGYPFLLTQRRSGHVHENLLSVQNMCTLKGGGHACYGTIMNVAH